MNEPILIPYESKYEADLVHFLDANRKFNVDLDQYKMRTYEKTWAEGEKQKVLESIENKFGSVFIIEVKKEIIGLLYYFVEDPIFKIAHISKIYIEPEFRGKGIGRSAIAKLEAILKDLGFKYAKLNVFGPNKVAVGLYRKLGYEDRFIDMMKPL